MKKCVTEHFSLGDWTTVVVAACLAAVAVMLWVAFVMLMLSSPRAYARDVGQWDGADAATRQWYRTLMQPDNPGASCCGEADAYHADDIHVRDGRVYATITDRRDDGPLRRQHIPPGTVIEIPPHKLKWDSGNPTGHNIVFIGGGSVLCFVQNGGV